MRKVFLFMMVSLDGFFEGPNHDLSWHNVDEEFNRFAASQLDEADYLLFGRRTYELMASFWPTYKAAKGEESDARVAERMNTLPKIVFSKTLETVKWSKKWDDIRLVKDNVAEEITKLKQQPGKDLAILGSNNFCVSLLHLGLLDELRIMVNPVVIGDGTPLFKGIEDRLSLKLVETKIFNSGNVLLCYQIEKR